MSKIVLENVAKVYKKGNRIVKALDNISLEIEQGRFVVLNGPSGSGKTTLLMAIAGMLRPTSGKIFIGDKNLYEMSMQARTKYRAANIGFVFQLFHLVPYLNVTENIAFASNSAAKDNNIDGLVKNLGISERSRHKPWELSAGEKQRTAIARAMINNPGIILADEPTGNLDPENADVVFGYLAEFQRSGGTVIVATHQASAGKNGDRIIRLRNGCIENDD